MRTLVEQVAGLTARYARRTVLLRGMLESIGLALEDWMAVAQAISQRMTELDIKQRELIERSQVSKETVGELCHNSAQRRRSARTLEALSMALQWRPQHLVAVLKGPPRVWSRSALRAVARHPG